MEIMFYCDIKYTITICFLNIEEQLTLQFAWHLYKNMIISTVKPIQIAYTIQTMPLV